MALIKAPTAASSDSKKRKAPSQEQPMGGPQNPKEAILKDVSVSQKGNMNPSDTSDVQPPSAKKKTGSAKDPASATRTKRKAGNINGAGESPAKKRKLATTAGSSGESPNEDQANTPSVPKRKRASPRAINPTKHKKAADAAAMPPPPMPPLPLTKSVANKVKQVCEFVESDEVTKLDRDPNDKNLITLTWFQLIAALMTMRIHYEVGAQQDADAFDVEEAIVQCFKAPIGANKVDYDWFVVDVSKAIEFEDRIQEKIARHGLDDVNLFEIELELRKRDEMRVFGPRPQKEDGETQFDPEHFARTFEYFWNKMIKEEADETERANEEIEDDADDEAEDEVKDATLLDQAELGRRGVCVAPMVQF